MLSILNDFATSSIKPDLTFVLDIELSESIRRVGKNQDRMEKSGLDFLNRVKEGYHSILNTNKERYRLIECGNRSIESINDEIIAIINDFYKELIK